MENARNYNEESEELALIIEKIHPSFEIVKPLARTPLKILLQIRENSSKMLLFLRVLRKIERKDYTNIRRFFYQTEKITHPNIIKYFHLNYLKENSLLLITNQYSPTSLLDLLSENAIEMQKCLDFFKQIVEGVLYLHQELRILHGNLKLSNIFLIDNLIKISDFKDFSPTKPVDFSDFSCVQTLAPEVFLQRNAENLSEKSEIWTLGVIFFELLTKNHPFLPKSSNSKTNAEKLSLLHENLSKSLSFYKEEFENNAIVSRILDNCLEIDAKKRPNAAQLLSFIKDYEEKLCFLKRKSEQEVEEERYFAAKVPMNSLAKGLASFGVKNFNLEKTTHIFLSSQKDFFRNIEVLPLFSEVLKLECFNLLELHVNDCQLGDLPMEFYQMLVNGLLMNKSIEKLEISRNNLGENHENFKLLCEALARIPCLKHLNFMGNGLGTHIFNMKYLKQLIVESKTLQFLDLSSNNIGKYIENMAFFWECLKESKSLQELYLSRNELGNVAGIVKMLCDGIKFNKSLKTLDLSGNLLGKDLQNIDNLNYALKVNKTLTYISLSSNDLGLCGNIIGMLGQFLIMTKNLQELNISLNNLGKCNKSIKYLSKALKENTSVLKLNLHGNKLNTEVIPLLNSLVLNQNLTHLILSENELANDLEIAKTLADFVSFNENLQVLDLSFNELGNQSEFLRFFMEALKINTSLKTVFLNAIKLKEKVENLYVLACMLRTNQTLNAVFLYNNELNDIDDEKFLSEKGQICIYR